MGLSGTPGTGKKTIAPLVARSLGLPLCSLNDLARDAGARPGPDEELEVDPARLRAALKSVPPGSLVYGHLVPHVLGKTQTRKVAVLRCEPSVLYRRLKARGYPREKIVENVEAELIGVVLDECLRRFGPALVDEYDTTSSPPREVAKKIVRDSASNASRAGRPYWIDWTLAYDSSSKLRSLLDGAIPPAST